MPTVFEVLKGLLPEASNNTLRGLVKDGRVSVGDRKPKAVSEDVPPGARVLILPRRPAAENKLAPLTLVHEDDDLIVVDKPRGLITSTTPREKRATALQKVQDYLSSFSKPKQAVAVHRLDRDACGLLVFAKSPRAVERLKKQFFEHTVERRYLAVVRGAPQPADGRIDHALVERADGVVRLARPGDDGKECSTRYRTLKATADRAWLAVELETGRKHQIRAHLAGIGHPLIGDELYGGGKGPLLLCAVSLAFDHPIRPKRLHFEREAPPDMSSDVV